MTDTKARSAEWEELALLQNLADKVAGGIAPATNDICGYLVVEADAIEAAAQLFADHPHIQTFPVMPSTSCPS